ncbi:ISL3 family transposase [Rhodococcus opacus]|uniref:ISL3 family transposase n=1 Tax=Rhodococcus opacus TaxID=37919 RepID=UPI00155A39A3|nr:ISL3 family transposase [Rhodococcus opacus]
MREARIWRQVLGVEKTVIEGVDFDATAVAVIVAVRPQARARSRCGVCGRRSPGYDGGTGRRRWRGPDCGLVRTFIEADAPRVSCREHGVTVAAVPWARHRAGHTYSFDQTVAWLATHTSKAATCEVMRTAWRTVGAIVDRVWADTAPARDPLAGLRRIGIDEISYKKGHKYLTVVVDHDSGRLVWAAPGRDAATLSGFFDRLGPERCAKITHVTSDAAGWIGSVVARYCPDAIRCADPFHVVAWATEALDAVRRAAWNRARATETASRGGGWKPRRRPKAGPAQTVKRSRWALLKNPDTLNAQQRATLRWIELHDPVLHRAYLLKETLRLIFQLPAEQAATELDRWIGWARRSRIPAFVALQKSIRAHKPAILAAIEHGLSNGRIESVNTKIRLITRRGFGFHTPEAVIALAMLSLGGARPQLPGRTHPRMSQ